MSPGFDAFGRRTDGTDPAGEPAPAASVVPGHRERRDTPPGHRRPVLGALVLLLVGAVAIAGTLRLTVRSADGDPQAVALALAHDPLGPRSLLRPERVRPALRQLRSELRPGDRVGSLVFSPTHVSMTITDPRDQQRSRSVDAAGRGSGYSFGGADDDHGFDLGALRPEPALRFAAAKYRALQPYARQPEVSPSVDGDTGAVTGWVVGFSGVRAVDRSWLLNASGRLVR